VKGEDKRKEEGKGGKKKEGSPRPNAHRLHILPSPTSRWKERGRKKKKRKGDQRRRNDGELSSLNHITLLSGGGGKEKVKFAYPSSGKRKGKEGEEKKGGKERKAHA